MSRVIYDQLYNLWPSTIYGGNIAACILDILRGVNDILIDIAAVKHDTQPHRKESEYDKVFQMEQAQEYLVAAITCFKHKLCIIC